MWKSPLQGQGAQAGRENRELPWQRRWLQRHQRHYGRRQLR